MSAYTSNDSIPARSDIVRVTVKNKAGLAIAVLLGLADVAGPFTIPAPKAGEQGPPMSVLIVSAVLGVITLVAVGYAWRTGQRLASRVVAGTRILSALSSVPAFFGNDIPAGLIVVAAAGITLTLLSTYLVLSRPAVAAAQE